MGFDLLPLYDTPDANTAIEGRNLRLLFLAVARHRTLPSPPSFSIRAHAPAPPSRPASSMIDTLPVDISSSFPDSLSSYNVHQLQFALSCVLLCSLTPSPLTRLVPLPGRSPSHPTQVR